MTARARTAKEVAEDLPVSEWWLKEKARKGLIPSTLLGGKICFTDQHVEQIIAAFERRPDAQAGQPAPAAPRRPPNPTRPTGGTAQLKSRRPRRLRNAS